MAEDKKKKQCEAEEAEACEKVNAEENAETDEACEASEGESREELVKSAQLEKELEQKSKELADLNDRFLRMAAEYDNYKKRTTKERKIFPL